MRGEEALQRDSKASKKKKNDEAQINSNRGPPPHVVVYCSVATLRFAFLHCAAVLLLLLYRLGRLDEVGIENRAKKNIPNSRGIAGACCLFSVDILLPLSAIF